MKYKISAFICLLISIISLSVLKVDAFKEVILFAPDPVISYDISVNFYDETGDTLLFKFYAYSGNNPTLKFTSGITSSDGIYCTGGTFYDVNNTSLGTFIPTRISYIQDCEIVVPLGFPSFSPDLFYISSSNTLTYNTHFFSDTNFYVKFAENPNAPSDYRLLTNADIGKKIGVDFEKNIWLDKSLNPSGIFHNSMLMFNGTSVSTKACMLDYRATSFSFRDRSAEEPEYFINSSTWQNFTNPTWYSRSDGSGTEYLIACYKSGDNYVNNVVYVKEKNSSYNVTYNAFTTDSFGGTIYTGTAPTNLIGVANLPDTLPVLTQNGYILDGWYYDSAYETLAAPGAALTSNVTLYAKWSIANYTISYYDSNGVTQFNNLSPTTYVMADRTITLPTPIKNGYSFLGWYDIDLENRILSIAPMSYGNLSLYAKWERTTYNITYYDGSTQLNLSPTTYDYTVGATLPTPTKTGYTFIGWRYNHGNGEIGYTDITNISANPSGVPNPVDYTLYAQWQENTYTITYYDGTNVLTGLSPSSYLFNHSAITLPTPTKANYVFDGWYTDNAFTTRVNALLSVDYGNKIYYSKWVEQAYTITYNCGSVYTGTIPTSVAVARTPSTLPVLTQLGYNFLGWYKNAQFTEAAASNERIYSNTTLYAKFSIIEYNITYYFGSMELHDNLTDKYYINTLPVNLNVPNIEGYEFINWYDNSNLTGSAISQIPLASTGNKIFYAKMKLKTYDVIFNCGNVYTGTVPDSLLAITNLPNELPILHQPGYEFLGWYNITYTTEYTTGQTINSDTTVYAKWNVIGYTIKYFDGITEIKNLTPYSFNVVSETITLPIPTKENYTFNGWYDNDSLTGPFVNNIRTGSIGNKEFYASFTRDLYNISYYDTDRSTQLNLSPNKYDYSLGLDLPVPTKIGYTFVTWRYYHGEGETGYTDMTSISPNVFNPIDYFLSAQWAEQTYTITYFDGTTVLTNLQPQIYSYVHDPIILPTITKPNAVFAGWYSDSSLTEKVNALLSVDYGNKTFYAKWEGDFINEINRTIYKNPNSVLTTADVVSILKDNISIYGNNYSLEVVNDAYTGHGNVLGTYTINFNLKRNNISVRNFDFNVVVNDNITCRYYYNKTFYIGSEDEFTYADYISILRYLEDLPNAEINYTIVSALRTDTTKDYFALEKKANGVYESIINYTSTAGYNGSRRYLLNVFETAPYSIVEKKDYTFTSGEKALIIAVFLGFVIGGVIIYNKVLKPKIGKKNKSGYDVTYVYNPNNKKGGNFKK